MIYDRQPAVAGQFYPLDEKVLCAEVRKSLDLAGPRRDKPSILVMVPHAGYVFSGSVAGKTLGAANLPDTLVVLCPNHTGMGLPFSVWPEGEWELPGGAVAVDDKLSAELVDAVPGFAPNTEAHLREHSLEVVLPFLREVNPKTKIVPVCVREFGLPALLQAGRALGQALAGRAEPVSLVVSSDMSHQIPEIEARRLDELALNGAASLDPAAFYATVRNNAISMCGVLPMTVGLAAATEMGATRAELIAYATSGDVLGDRESVVGYAGLIVE